MLRDSFHVVDSHMPLLLYIRTCIYLEVCITPSKSNLSFYQASIWMIYGSSTWKVSVDFTGKKFRLRAKNQFQGMGTPWTQWTTFLSYSGEERIITPSLTMSLSSIHKKLNGKCGLKKDTPDNIGVAAQTKVQPRSNSCGERVHSDIRGSFGQLNKK